MGQSCGLRRMIRLWAGVRRFRGRGLDALCTYHRAACQSKLEGEKGQAAMKVAWRPKPWAYQRAQPEVANPI